MPFKKLLTLNMYPLIRPNKWLAFVGWAPAHRTVKFAVQQRLCLVRAGGREPTLQAFCNFFITAVIMVIFMQSSVLAQTSTAKVEEFGLPMEELVSKVEAVEADIASCMSEAGFEYIANDFASVRQGMVADKSLPGVSDEQFIAQYGFGITTLYTGQPPQLSEVATPAQLGLGEQNIGIFKSLSEADQVAYTRTLFGDDAEATFAVGLETEDFSQTGGCTRKAIEAQFSPEQLNSSYVNPMDVRIEQDPRMIAALEKFRDCLRDAGFDYNNDREIEADLRKRLFAIAGGAPVDSLPEEARTALTELQGYERELAVVLVECDETILEPVAVQIEQELFSGSSQ